MIQHMNLVFQAEGLSVGEGAFLLACCNHTDAKGYVIASMQQLADESHMKMTAAKSNKQRLIQRGLLASSERYSPKNGARIADLYRVNLDLLASMKRARTDYGPTLVEELTFNVPQENRRSDPPSDSDPSPRRIPTSPRRIPTPPRRIPTPPRSGSDGDAGSDSDPLLLPSISPSSLSLVAEHADGPMDTSPDGEREDEALLDEHSPCRAELPQQREQVGQSAGERVVAAYAEALGRPVMNGTRARLERQAVELLAQGLPEAWLCDRVREMAPRGWSNLVQHVERSTAPLPSEVSVSRRPGLPDWCGECGQGTPAARLNPRFRTLGELGSGEKCPSCHPDRVALAGA
ncbi:hypothetical protein [Streptomyces griseorubiginosus]|uniref:Helix-turn-helix protein n=1 Tax=Streptomyces griseorubiginosus TaxID=67304 RepID=A0A101RMQ1_9ACTN|nr:hypothetical protein [Streptomyces griseorubiginosus]KUN58416.1 hypothetical protein AQJ54_41850 [Streptomyces griseorubiginosus]